MCTNNKNNEYSLSIYMTDSIGVDHQILKIELEALEPPVDKSFSSSLLHP